MINKEDTFYIEKLNHSPKRLDPLSLAKNIISVYISSALVNEYYQPVLFYDPEVNKYYIGLFIPLSEILLFIRLYKLEKLKEKDNAVRTLYYITLLTVLSSLYHESTHIINYFTGLSRKIYDSVEGRFSDEYSRTEIYDILDEAFVEAIAIVKAISEVKKRVNKEDYEQYNVIEKEYILALKKFYENEILGLKESKDKEIIARKVGYLLGCYIAELALSERNSLNYLYRMMNNVIHRKDDKIWLYVDEFYKKL